MAEQVNQKAGAAWYESDLLREEVGGYFQKEAAKNAKPVESQVGVSHLPQDRLEQQSVPMSPSQRAQFMQSQSAIGISNGAALLIAAGLLGGLLLIRSR